MAELHALRIAAALAIQIAPLLGQSVTGRVLDPDGAPVAGAAVWALPWRADDPLQAMLQRLRTAGAERESAAIATPEPLAGCRTAGDGSFAFAVPTTQPVDLRVVADRWPSLRRAPIRAAADRPTALGDLRLAAGVTVRGRVLSATTGAPLRGVPVRCVAVNPPPPHAPPPGREHGMQTRTDERGEFALAGCPSATTLQVLAADDAHCNAAHSLVATGPTVHCELRLWPGAPLLGIAVDDDGAPIAGARVRATATAGGDALVATARTGPNGAFALPPLPCGDRRVEVSAPGYRTVRREVGDPPGRLRCELQPIGVLLRVRAADGGPAGPSTVEVFEPRRGGPPRPPVHRTFCTQEDQSPAGAWLRFAQVGEFVVRVTAPGHAPTESPPVRVTAHEPRPRLELQLLRGTLLHGLLVDPEGRPVDSAHVRVTDRRQDLPPAPTSVLGRMPIPELRGEAFSDTRGLFTIPSLPPGRFRLVVRARGLLAFETEVDTGALPARLTLPPIALQRAVENGAGRR
ncbi:MAG: carboxypeptidase-like regulatory domain-containing protein [Planctomycetota bacterium]